MDKKIKSNSILKIPHIESALIEPNFLSSPAPWAGHIPFAAWLIVAIRPRNFVELGVYSGISYLSFCQAANQYKIPLRATGIDSWQGDSHSGKYGDTVFKNLQHRHDKHYGAFSNLLKMYFDEALPQFENDSIDLLHIDGLHTYAAVKHDFESWLPKLSAQAVVLFHDTTVHRDDFGVWQLWSELQKLYPSLSFEHSHGLGVLLVGKQAPALLRSLVDEPDQWEALKQYFVALGQRLELRTTRQVQTQRIKDLEIKSQSQHQWIVKQDQVLLELQRLSSGADTHITDLQSALAQREQQARENETNAAALLTTMQEALQAHDQALRQQQSHATDIEATLREREDELEKEKTHSALLLTNLDARETSLKEQQAVAAEIQKKITEYEAELQQQRIDLDQAQRTLQAKQAEAQKLQTDSRTIAATLQQRETELHRQVDCSQQLHTRLHKRDMHIQHIQKEQDSLRESVGSYREEIAAGQQQMREIVLQARRGTQELQTMRARTRATEALLQELYQSRSWRFTSGMRTLGTKARLWRASTWGARLWTTAKRMRNAMRYVATGNWQALLQRLQHVKQQAEETQRLQQFPNQVIRCGILATPHTLFVAHAIQAALERAGLSVEITPETDQGYPLEIYFVICPQIFKHLPPGEKRIAFQMEQTVSSRWFTPDYLALLENSLAVLDYSQSNLKPLASYGIVYPHVFFVPIGGISNYQEHSNAMTPHVQCDVLFYGDANTPRRRDMLQVIGQRFNLRIISNAFGLEMQQALAGAKVVINLHYYEEALLETTRLYECLSLGKAVVSEQAADQADHTELEGVVKFAPVGDIDALVAAISQSLAEQSDSMAQRQQALRRQALVRTSQARFELMLYRMLLARRLVSYDDFERLNNEQQLAPRLGLSLPETVARRQAFSQIRPKDVQVFDGLRFSPGWIGCALSYKFLARMALRQGLTQLEIMEDDVVFPANYPQREQRVHSYLAKQQGQWDVFVGVMAIVHPDTHVLHIEEHEGELFVTIDRMISAVCNIYTPKVLQRIAAWDQTLENAETNTIDRYLQSQGDIRAVVTLPFLVGHAEELDSSLWGFSNSRYAEMIAQAQQQLESLVEHARKNQQTDHLHLS